MSAITKAAKEIGSSSNITVEDNYGIIEHKNGTIFFLGDFLSFPLEDPVKYE